MYYLGLIFRNICFTYIHHSAPPFHNTMFAIIKSGCCEDDCCEILELWIIVKVAIDLLIAFSRCSVTSEQKGEHILHVGGPV